MTDAFKKTICDALDGFTINGQRFEVEHVELTNLNVIRFEMICNYDYAKEPKAEEVLPPGWVPETCCFCNHKVAHGCSCNCKDYQVWRESQGS